MAIVEPTLCQKLEGMYRTPVELVRRVYLRRGNEEQTEDELEVLVFELRGHPEARSVTRGKPMAG